MRWIISLCLAFSLIGTSSYAATWELLQEKATLPLSTTAIGEIAPILVAIMSSNMDAAAKERSVVMLTDIAKMQIETKAKIEENKWGRFFDIMVRVLTLAGAVFATVKVTT